MKKINLLFLFILIGFFASASDLRLRMFDNGNFSVQFDANKYESNHAEVYISKIISGSHYLKVTKSRVYFANGKRFVTKDVLFDTYVYIKEKSIITATINENREFVVEKVRPITNNNKPNTTSSNTNNHHNQGGSNGNGSAYQTGDYYNNQNSNNQNYNNQNNNHQNNNNQNNNSYNNNGHPNGGNQQIGLNKVEFEMLMNTLKNESFDDTKLTIAKDAIRANGTNTLQIIEIMEEFSFESTKLDFAKFAYDLCIDRNNYFVVNKCFTYDSSKEELSKFINGKK